MNCNIGEDQLVGYLLATASPKELELLESHISSCPKCQKRFQQLMKAKSVFGKWQPDTPPQDLIKKVMNNIKAQKLIEAKTAQSTPADAQTDRTVQWLKKRVKSEQIRIYKMLTDFLGKQKGEKVFDYYLETELKEQMSIPREEYNIIARSLDIELDIQKLDNGAVKETVHNCPNFMMAQELDVQFNPCERICSRMTKLREKFQPVRSAHVKKMPNKDNECIFLFTPVEQNPVS